jgi:hypothetical protein
VRHITHVEKIRHSDKVLIHDVRRDHLGDLGVDERIILRGNL